MNERWRYGGLLGLLGIGWGATQPLGKIATSTGYGNFGLIFWQAIIGALVLGIILLLRRKSVPLNRRSLSFATIVALIGTIIPNSTFYISVSHLPAGIMSILISTIPLMSFPIALALRMDQFSGRRLLGIVCGLIAVALIALPKASLAPGMAAWLPLAMIGPFFYAIEGNFVAKWGTAGLDAMQAMFLASLAAALVDLPLVILTGQWISPLPPYGWPELALILSSSLHALLYTGYVWLAARAGAVFAAQTGYVVTASGVFWAMLILGERFSQWIWIALIVLFLGLSLVMPRPRKAASV